MLYKEGERKEKPFAGKKVFFSGTIRGAERETPGFFWGLVQFMKEGGADVLDEHVSARSKEEMDRIFHQNTGVRIGELESPRETVRQMDIGWVDEADYLVAETTFPSLGVGMEIQRAIDKDGLGLNHTKILCLCRQDVLDRDGLSWMVGGVNPEEHSDFDVLGYTTVQEVKDIIFKFLTGA